MQKGLKKGLSRERLIVNKVNKDVQENRRTDQMSNNSESARYDWRLLLLIVSGMFGCLQRSLLF